jgi:hypothetical protein
VDTALVNGTKLREFVDAAMGQHASDASTVSAAAGATAAVCTTGPASRLAGAARPVAASGLVYAAAIPAFLGGVEAAGPSESATTTAISPFLGAVATPCPSESATALPVPVALVPTEYAEMLAND